MIGRVNPMCIFIVKLVGSEKNRLDFFSKNDALKCSQNFVIWKMLIRNVKLLKIANFGYFFQKWRSRKFPNASGFFFQKWRLQSFPVFWYKLCLSRDISQGWRHVISVMWRIGGLTIVVLNKHDIKKFSSRVTSSGT